LPDFVRSCTVNDGGEEEEEEEEKNNAARVFRFVEDMLLCKIQA